MDKQGRYVGYTRRTLSPGMRGNGQAGQAQRSAQQAGGGDCEGERGREHLQSGFAVVAMSAIGEGNITLWQRLKRQKHGLGNMALAASTLLLALRLVDQDKELERMRAGESSLLEALRRENQSVQVRFDGFRAAVEAEVERAGSRLPPLSTRLRTLLEKNEIEEPRPLVSHEQKEGAFLFITNDCPGLVPFDYRQARVKNQKYYNHKAKGRPASWSDALSGDAEKPLSNIPVPAS